MSIKKEIYAVESPLLQRNFGLSEVDFKKYVLLLKKGDECFLEHIANYHFDRCISILHQKFSINEDLSYDLCLDAMLAFRKKLLNDKIKYGNLSYLYTRMASNLYMDRFKKEKKIKEAAGFFIESNADDVQDTETMFEALDHAMNQLDDKDQTLLKEIYFNDKDVKQVAGEYDIAYSTLRKRKQRMLEKVKSLFTNQLKKS